MNIDIKIDDLITIGEACDFTKWVGYNAVRCSKHEFNCRIDNYRSRYTLLDLYKIYKKQDEDEQLNSRLGTILK